MTGASLLRAERQWLVLIVVPVLTALLSATSRDVVLGLCTLYALARAVSRLRLLKGAGGWRLFTWGAVALGFSPALTEGHKAIATNDVIFTVGDALAFFGYILMILGLGRIVRARTVARQATVMVESVLAASWVGYLLTVLWIDALSDQLGAAELVVAASYVGFSLVLLASVLQLVLGSSSRSKSFLYLCTAAAMAGLSEMGFLAGVAGHSAGRIVGTIAATIGLVLVAAGVSSEGAEGLERPIHIKTSQAFRTRSLISALSVIGLVGAAIAVKPDQELVFVAIGLLCFLTVLLAMLLTQERDRWATTEQRLRSYTTDLLKASDPIAIVDRATAVVDEVLMKHRTRYAEILTADEFGEFSLQSGGDGISRTVDGPDLQRAIVSQELQRGEYRTGPNAQYASRVVAPLGRDSVLLVEASPVLTAVETSQIEMVAANTRLALDVAAAREREHRERSDRRFRALVQDSNDIILVANGETQLVEFVSPTLERLLGVEEHEILGSDALDLVIPEDREHILALREHVAPNRNLDEADVRAPHADGYNHWLSLVIRDLTDDADVEGMVFSFADINERKLAELQLGNSELQYRTMVENASDVFSVIDDDYTVNYISQNVEKLLGYGASELIGSDVRGFLTERGRADLSAFIARREVRTGDTTADISVRTNTGAELMLAISLSDATDLGSGVMVTMRDVTETRRLEEAIRTQALHDELTGLFNRASLRSELERVLQRMTPEDQLGVIHIDLDNFHPVNESLGFETGDQLLIDVAARLRAELRGDDVLARPNGDEFTILTVHESVENVEAFATRIRRVFERPFRVSGKERKVDASFGLVVTDDLVAQSRALLEAAAIATNMAKSDKAAPFVRFMNWMREEATENFEIAADISEGMRLDQFRLAYQPVLTLSSRMVRSVEALLRWQHPIRGNISPGVFIPMAESSGEIVELGRWVLETACTQLHEWHQSLPGGENLSVSVNVSARQLELDGETDRLRQIILDSEVNPAFVTIELTETVMVDDSAWLGEQLDIFRSLGVSIAVDDFGSGSAGINQLKDLPFDVLKIDKRYIDDICTSDEAQTIVSSVVELAHSLGAKTVGEGIETPPQADVLRRLNCDYGQGFYLGKPMDSRRIETWFRQGWDGKVPALIERSTGW